jgi:3-hydroxyisobutyrate dehydrogenase-like beta-hydroxyacid dehydrogenase
MSSASINGSNARLCNMSSNKPRLCFIGFGEAGQAIASGLREAGVEQIAAWDILFPRTTARAEAGGREDRRAARVSAADAVATPTSSCRR